MSHAAEPTADDPGPCRQSNGAMPPAPYCRGRARQSLARPLMSNPDTAERSRGIVIGAGIDGLTAAGALAGQLDQVIVLERESLPPVAV